MGANGTDNGQYRALRNFCEMAYQPNDQRLGELLKSDWSAYPRIRTVLDRLPKPLTRESVSAAAQSLLATAVDDLAELFPVLEGNVTPLEVFRWHVVDRQPWPSIEAMLAEQGRPYSRGTLIRRQHELLPHLAVWAEEELHPADSSSSTGADRPSGPTAWRRWILAGAVVTVASLVGLTALRTDEPESSEPASTLDLRPDRIGRQIANVDWMEALPDPYPPFPLPQLEPRVWSAMILEPQEGEFRLLLAQRRGTNTGGSLFLWDPVEEEMLWECSFVPPDSERFTHDGIGPEVLSELYWPNRMHYAGPEGDLGRHAVVTMVGRYSPTFVLFVDLDTGHVDGYYVHPGFLLFGIVADTDGDGSMEALLGGQDNAVDRPVFVALHPGSGVSAASTVAWNEAGEGALARVLLPKAPETLGPLNSERLETSFIDNWFDAHERTIYVGVGATPGTVYHARLGESLRPVLDPTLVLWDSDTVLLRELGVDPALVEEWENDIIYLAHGDRDTTTVAK